MAKVVSLFSSAEGAADRLIPRWIVLRALGIGSSNPITAFFIQGVGVAVAFVAALVGATVVTFALPSATANADQRQVLGAAAFLDDLVGEATQSAVDLRGGH